MMYLILGLIFLLGVAVIIAYYEQKKKRYWQIIAYTLYEDLIRHREKASGKKIDALTYHTTLSNGHGFEFTIGSKNSEKE